MRVSEAGLALIRRTGPGGRPEYLSQWSDRWLRLSLVGGHVEPGETFRDCCRRETAEELELVEGSDFRVAPEPVAATVEYTAHSAAAGVDTLYRVQLFAVELLSADARDRVDRNPLNRWLSEPEIRRHAAADGTAVAAQIETVFARAGVLPVRAAVG